MHKWYWRAICITGLTLVAPNLRAQSATHDSLTGLAQEMTDSWASRYPMQATAWGFSGHDAELEAPSEAYRAASIAELQRRRQQLRALEAGFGPATSLVDRDDARLLGAQLEAQLNAFLVYRKDRKDYAAAANNIVNAIFIQFEHLPVPGQENVTPRELRAAWSDIIGRLSKAPGYILAAQRLVTTPGHRYGIVGSKQLEGAAEFFNGALTEAARTQLGADEAAFARFQGARDAVLAVISDSRAYIDAHADSWPENYAMGRKAYDRMLQQQQLLPFDADEIERIGQDELAHGWAEEAWLRAMSKRSSTPFGAPSGGGLAPGGPALIDYYRARIDELRQFVLDNDVVTIPDWLGSITVMETPPFLQPVSPGASMDPPRLFSSSGSGYYYITPPKSLEDAAARLDMNVDFDRDRVLATAAHEAMPGHFLQLSIARRHPDFVRKLQDSDVFAEGWAFYGEEMFLRLGLYGADLDARLVTARWERVRGARAIVDPKLATGEWSFEQAMGFFAAQTGFTRDDAEAAVSSMATDPGEVIAYAVGRLQLENLLAEYMRRMGDRASLHDFHDRLLSYGTTPFAIVGPELMADLDKPASAVRAAANY